MFISIELIAIICQYMSDDGSLPAHMQFFIDMFLDNLLEQQNRQIDGLSLLILETRAV
jgi:hypothetical protein